MGANPEQKTTERSPVGGLMPNSVIFPAAPASSLAPRRLDIVLLLDPSDSGRESEADVCAALPHLNFRGSHVSKKVLWRWASGVPAGMDTLAAAAVNLHTGGSGLSGRFSLDPKQQ